MCNKPTRPVLSPTVEESMVYPFSEKEYRRGIATLKNNKTAEIDEVLVEHLNNLGPKLTSGCLQYSSTASLRTRSQQYWGNRRSSPYWNQGNTLRYPKDTDQYIFCVTRTNSTNDYPKQNTIWVETVNLCVPQGLCLMSYRVMFIHAPRRYNSKIP